MIYFSILYFYAYTALNLCVWLFVSLNFLTYSVQKSPRKQKQTLHWISLKATATHLPSVKLNSGIIVMESLPRRNW